MLFFSEININPHDFVAQNIDIIMQDVYPIFEGSLGRKLHKISNQIFSIAPFNEFFPNHWNKN